MTQKKQLELIKQVHGDNAITAILYSAASMFQDTIVEEIQFFPILFNTGTFATGKSQISETMQFLSGSIVQSFDFSQFLIKKHPKVLHLQLKSPITIIDDYIKGNDKYDSYLKSIWDRKGFQRGTKKGTVALEEIKINSALVLNGNTIPKDKFLITRFIWNEFTKTDFSKSDNIFFDDLAFLKRNKLILGLPSQKGFQNSFKEAFKPQHELERFYFHELMPKTHTRILDNYCVLFSAYAVLKDFISFPFSESDIITHFHSSITSQNRCL